MPLSRLFRTLPAILSAFVIVSCSDSGVSGPPGVDDFSSVAAPLPPAPTDQPLNVTGLELKALWWDRDHKNVSVSKTIGPAGGTISIPATGLTMSFPAGAVTAPVTITITADEEYVAYKMEPSGTVFLKDVIATQSLSATELAGRLLKKPLYVAYIADDRVSLKGNVPVLELEPSQTTFSPLNALLPVAHVWIIRHFSRYMLSSG